MGDIYSYLSYCLQTLAWWFAPTLVVAIILIFASRKTKQPPRWKLLKPTLLVSAASWIIFFSITAKEALALTLLDSESDQTAEYAYQKLFTVNLKEALRIAKNDSYSGNIRFYAAFRAADLLATNDERTVAGILNTVADAPEFQTGFFGWNSVNRGYFKPCYQEGPFQVGDLVQRRLQEIRGLSNASIRR